MTRLFVPVAAGFALAAGPALTEGGASVDGDAEYGEYLSSECVTCHRGGGEAGGIPPITGWAAADFVLAMYDFKTGVRQHEVMEMVAERLGDEEIASLAVYFESLGAAHSELD